MDTLALYFLLGLFGLFGVYFLIILLNSDRAWREWERQVEKHNSEIDFKNSVMSRLEKLEKKTSR